MLKWFYIISKCESELSKLELVLPSTEPGPGFNCTSPHKNMILNIQRVETERNRIWTRFCEDNVSAWYVTVSVASCMYSSVYLIATCKANIILMQKNALLLWKTVTRIHINMIWNLLWVMRLSVPSRVFDTREKPPRPSDLNMLFIMYCWLENQQKSEILCGFSEASIFQSYYIFV